MLKFLRDKKKDNKGFTLVELVIVVAILAILVGILAPQYTKYVEKSRKAADVSNLENLVTVTKTAASDATDAIPAGEYTITLEKDKKVAVAATGTGTGADADKLKAVFVEFAGDDWDNVMLKSKNWANNKIAATITLDADGKVTVRYNPDTIKNTVAGESEKTDES